MPIPFVEAEFPREGEPIRLIRMELVRSSYRHEVAVLRVHSDSLGRKSTGSPIFASWGVFPGRRESFHGYVHHDEPVYSEDHRKSRRPLTDLVCVGATGVLGEPDSRSWLHTRLDLMAEDIAKDARLFFSGDKTDRVVSNVVQAAESSWKFLARRSERQGKVVFGRGAKVVLVDRARSFQETTERSPVISRSEVTKMRGFVGDLDLMDREVVAREGFALGRDGLVAYTDRKNTGDRLDAVRREPQERRIVVGTPAEDADELSASIQDKSREREFLNNLEVTVRGVLPGLFPCSPVVLRDFGRRYDGHWSVNSVKYRPLPQKEAFTEIELVKALVLDDRKSPSLRGTRPVDVHAQEGDREPRLMANRWVAS